MSNKERLDNIKSALARAIETATDNTTSTTAATVDGWSKEQRGATLAFPFARSTW
jgi:hypothetical protein